MTPKQPQGIKTVDVRPNGEKYQNLVFELTDGSVHRFTGKAFTKKNEDRRIVFDSIKFTVPKKLPDGCEWSEL